MRFKIVETGEIALAVPGSCPKFPDNRSFGQFAGSEYVLEVLAHCADIDLEEFRHALLGEPKTLVFEHHLDTNVARSASIEQNLAFAWYLCNLLSIKSRTFVPRRQFGLEEQWLDKDSRSPVTFPTNGSAAPR